MMMGAPRAASGSAVPLAPLGDLEKKHMSRLEQLGLDHK